MGDETMGDEMMSDETTGDETMSDDGVSREPIPEDSLERGHERRDLGVRVMVAFGAGLALLTVLAMLVSTVTYSTMEERRVGAGEPPSPLAERDRKPPEPRLQVEPGRQLQRLRAEERALLRQYAWIDRESGIVRIPVERAMDLLAERGLPTVPADGGPAENEEEEEEEEDEEEESR